MNTYKKIGHSLVILGIILMLIFLSFLATEESKTRTVSCEDSNGNEMQGISCIEHYSEYEVVYIMGTFMSLLVFVVGVGFSQVAEIDSHGRKK